MRRHVRHGRVYRREGTHRIEPRWKGDPVKRLTARERALPGLIAEANQRLDSIERCAEGDWSAIDEAASYLAQHLRSDVQPDWDKYPLGTRRYERLGFARNKDRETTPGNGRTHS